MSEQRVVYATEPWRQPVEVGQPIPTRKATAEDLVAVILRHGTDEQTARLRALFAEQEQRLAEIVAELRA